MKLTCFYIFEPDFGLFLHSKSLNFALVLMYIFKGKHFTLGVFVPKVGHHVALNNVHSGCHVVVHECEHNYPCLATGGSHYACATLKQSSSSSNPLLTFLTNRLFCYNI